MHRRSMGFVGRYRYLSVSEAATLMERHGAEIREREVNGEIPMFQSSSGQWITPVEALGMIDRRLTEH